MITSCGHLLEHPGRHATRDKEIQCHLLRIASEFFCYIEQNLTCYHCRVLSTIFSKIFPITPTRVVSSSVTRPTWSYEFVRANISAVKTDHAVWEGTLHETECVMNASKPEHAPKIICDAGDYTRDYRRWFVAKAEHPCVHELPSDCKRKHSIVFYYK